MDATDDTPGVLLLQPGLLPSHPAFPARCVERVEDVLAILGNAQDVAVVVFPPDATTVDGRPLMDVVRELRPDVVPVALPCTAAGIATALHRQQVQRATTWVTRGCVTVLPRAGALARLRDTFHDANNPLGALLGNLTCIGLAPPDAHARDAVADSLEALAVIRRVFDRARTEATPPAPFRQGPTVTVAALVEAVVVLLATVPRVHAVPHGTLASAEVAFWGPLLLLLLDGGPAALEIQRQPTAWQLDVHHQERREPDPAAAELAQCLGGTLEPLATADGGTTWRVLFPAQP